MRLEAGDAILLPHGGMHALVSDPDAPCREINGFEVAKICDTVASVASAGVSPARCATTEPGAGDALIFSACMELDLGGMQPLVGTMPEFMHVGTLLARYPEIRPMLDAMEREACSARAGFAGILARLADVVAAFIVRGWVECGCGDATGWVQRCANRSSAARSSRCIATRAATGAWRNSRPKRACRVRCSPNAFAATG